MMTCFCKMLSEYSINVGHYYHSPAAAANTWVHHELGDLRGAPKRGQQVLHSLRAHLAVSGLYLPSAGVPGDS